MNRLNIYSYMR